MKESSIWLTWGIAIGSLAACIAIINHYYLVGLAFVVLGACGGLLSHMVYQIYKERKK